MSLDIIELPLEGAKLIRPKFFPDERGFFWECYRKPLYAKYGIDIEFVQDNHSFSKKNTIRGMHFQTYPGQAKLVSIFRGRVYDVIVDIRPASPTFGRSEGIILDADTPMQLFIPVGFAHGFCVLSEEAHIFYKVSSLYNPLYEKAFRFDDPEIGIQWPVKDPFISERDRSAPLFNEIILC